MAGDVRPGHGLDRFNGNELLLKPDNTVVGTRYHDFNGDTVALRTSGKITYLLSDAQGTATTQIEAATQAVTRRRTTIFGAPRGTAAAGWQGTKGFVGGTLDSATGLTHLGAREYDPTAGRFASVDPALETSVPQSLNGYAYGNGNGNPTTFTNPHRHAHPRRDRRPQRPVLAGSALAEISVSHSLTRTTKVRKGKPLDVLYDAYGTSSAGTATTMPPGSR
jgi:RHS repeat-associated protein